MSLLEHIVKTDPFASADVSVRFVRTVDDWVGELGENKRKEFRKRLTDYLDDPSYFYKVVDDRTDKGVGQKIDEVTLIAAYEIAQEMMGKKEDDFYLELGERTVDEGAKGNTSLFFISKLFTVGQIVDRIANLNPAYNNVLEMEVEDKTFHTAIIRRKTKPEQIKKYEQVFGDKYRRVLRNNCLITIGMLKAIPKTFKKKEAMLEELSCEHTTGEDECRYKLRWGWGWSKADKKEKKNLIEKVRVYEGLILDMESTMSTLTDEIRHQSSKMYHEEMEKLRRQAMIGMMARLLGHDIRGLLTGTHGYIQMIGMIASKLEDGPEKEMLMKYVGKATDATEEVGKFAQDISTYARKGELSLRRRSLRAAGPVNKAMENFYGFASTQGVQFKKIFDYEGAFQADMRIEMVFNNLVKNAIESMPHGGMLSAHVYREKGKEDWIVYEISDTGTGIPTELKGKIFTEGATHGKKDGTGLGLYGASEIVKAHGGNIGYSTSKNGTVFIVKLPVISDAEPHDSDEYLRP